MADDLDRQAADFFGAPVDAPPAAAPDLDKQADQFFTDTTEAEADADATRERHLQQGVASSRTDALRVAQEVGQQYFATPRIFRAWVTASPAIQDELNKIKSRSANLVERTGGALAYWAGRPVQMTTWRGLTELQKRFPGGADAFARLAETMPEPGTEHNQEVPSQAANDQLDDLAGQPSDKELSWIDREPQYMEKMATDMGAEKLHVAANYGGDWAAYQSDLDAMPLRQRIGTRLEFLTKDLLAPDPLFLVDKPLAVLKLIPEGAKIIDQAVAARKLGESLKDIRGAVETTKAVHAPIGDLTKHVDKLEQKLATLTEAAPDELARVKRRLMEAKAELTARRRESAEPIIRLFETPKRDPETIYKPLDQMSAEEAAVRAGEAEQFAPIGEVDGVMEAHGYKGIQGYADLMDEAHVALATGKPLSPEADKAMRLFNTLPEPVRDHLDALGVSRKRVLRSAALRNPQPADITQAADFVKPEVAASRAFMGPDDVEEAGRGLAHMRDGGDPADILMHNIEMPEHSVVGQGSPVKPDGIFLRDLPTYRNMRKNGLREMSRGDAMRYLLGRQYMPGLAAGSTHVDVPGLVKAANKVGRKLAFGASRFAPLSLSTFAPEVAATFDKAAMNYKLYTNESQDFLSAAFGKSGMVKKSRLGTLKPAKGQAGALDHVIDMLDTPVDPVTHTSPEFEALQSRASKTQIELHNSIRSWLDAMGERLQIPQGTGISGYFPHLFPDYQRAAGLRAPEYIGVNRKAYVSFFALKKRTGAAGWNRDLINVLDLYNRGAHRKIVMEPAYQRILGIADEYTKKGMHDEASYTQKFLADARGMAGPSVFERAADHMDIPQRARDAVETTVREVTALFYKGLLGGNANYAIQNMAGGLTNTAAQHGAFHLMQGLLQFATPEGIAAAEKSGVYREALHSLQGLPRNASQALEDAYKVMDVGQRTEHILRGVAYNTALSEQVSKSGKTWEELRKAGLSEAYIREAARLTDRSQHVFGPTGRSPFLHSMLGHTGYQSIVQLGSYPAKQTEFILRNAAADPGFIMRYFAYSGMAARGAAEAAGVALGPSVGLGYLDSVTHPRKGRVLSYAPLFELLASTTDMYQSWKSGDPQEMKRTREAWYRAAEAGAPFVNQLEKYARNLRESFVGEKEKFSAMAGRGEVARQLLEGNPKIATPERKLTGHMERITHALGIQSVADTIERQGREAGKQERFTKLRRSMERKENRRIALEQKERALADYDKALRSGDAGSAHEIYAKHLLPEGIELSGDTAQARREAAFLRNRLGYLKHAPGFMPVE
jgi:hypothetical protein